MTDKVSHHGHLQPLGNSVGFFYLSSAKNQSYDDSVQTFGSQPWPLEHEYLSKKLVQIAIHTFMTTSSINGRANENNMP